MLKQEYFLVAVSAEVDRRHFATHAIGIPTCGKRDSVTQPVRSNPGQWREVIKSREIKSLTFRLNTHLEKDDSLKKKKSLASTVSLFLRETTPTR